MERLDIDFAMDQSTASSEAIDYRSWLRSELEKRCQANPRYSMRKFAQALQMDSSSVAQIISGKRAVSAKIMDKLCDQLGVEPSLRMRLLTPVRKFRSAARKMEPAPAFVSLQDEIFSAISEWQHYAILELVTTEAFESKPTWIAKRLGLRAVEAQIAIDRLKRLDLLVEKNGRLQRTKSSIGDLSRGKLDLVSTAAAKKSQSQAIEKAGESLYTHPGGSQEMSFLTLAIEPSKLEVARAKIEKFKKEMSKLLSESKKPSEVYQLNIQFFPLSHPDDRDSQ